MVRPPCGLPEAPTGGRRSAGAALGRRSLLLEHGYCGVPHREATLHAAALGLHDCGADGIYLFNFPCWRETQPHPFWSWVPPLAEPQLLAGRDLDFAIIDGTHRVPGIDIPAPLPALRAGENQIVVRNSGNDPATISKIELQLRYSLLPLELPPAPGTVTLHVAPSGDDRNSGSIDAPFRSLEKARDAARAARKAGAHDVAVVLRGGVHELQETLVLGAEDSGRPDHPVRYCAYPGESPVVSGGRRISGWEPGEGGRWKVKLESIEFRQLWVNGKRAVRARGPCPDGVERYGSLDAIDAEAGHIFPDGSMADWGNPGDIELGYFNSWSHMICRVESVRRDLSGRAIARMFQPGFFLASRKEGVQAKSPAYVENALELLDEPGEWYHDRRLGVLHFLPRPGEDPATAVAVVPVLETLLRLDGTPDAPVTDVAFEGITFGDATRLGPSRVGHADVQANFTIEPDRLFARDGWVVDLHNEYRKSPANVVLRAAERCRFQKCTFTRLGGAGLDIERGSADVAVVDCRFHDISGSAVQIGDVRAADHHPPDPRLIVREISVLGCEIRDCGVEYEDSVGVFAGYARGATIAHNEISSLPYSGISVGWGWGEEDAGGGTYAIPFVYATLTPAGANQIERNHIYHVMLRRDDGGGIYTLGNQPGSAIRWNHIHDNGPGGPGGIYLDEGSGFIEIAGNVVYRVSRPMNYNNRAQDRIATCFEHDNAFGVEPGAEGYPEETAARAGRPAEPR